MRTQVAVRLWDWLAAELRRGLLTLWLEGYIQSLVGRLGVVLAALRVGLIPREV